MWQKEQANGQPREVTIEIYFNSSPSSKWPPCGLPILQYLSFGKIDQAGKGNSSKSQIISPWARLYTEFPLCRKTTFGILLKSLTPFSNNRQMLTIVFSASDKHITSNPALKNSSILFLAFTPPEINNFSGKLSLINLAVSRTIVS